MKLTVIRQGHLYAVKNVRTRQLMTMVDEFTGTTEVALFAHEVNAVDFMRTQAKNSTIGPRENSIVRKARGRAHWVKGFERVIGGTRYVFIDSHSSKGRQITVYIKQDGMNSKPIHTFA